MTATYMTDRLTNRSTLIPRLTICAFCSEKNKGRTKNAKKQISPMPIMIPKRKESMLARLLPSFLNIVTPLKTSTAGTDKSAVKISVVRAFAVPAA